MGQREVKAEPLRIDSGLNSEAYWSFYWYDLPPSRIKLHDPLVRIEVSYDGGNWQPLILDGVSVDDQGYEMAVRYQGKINKQNMGLYEARWYNPAVDGRAEYRFVILERGDQAELASGVFR